MISFDLLLYGDCILFVCVYVSPGCHTGMDVGVLWLESSKDDVDKLWQHLHTTVRF